MPSSIQELRIAVRSLLSSPLTTVAALLVITLGVGANLAVFAVTYGVLVRPLPYDEASRLAILSFRTPQEVEFGVPLAEVGEWQRLLSTAEAVAGYSVSEQVVRGAGEARLMRTAIVTDSFFEILGSGPDRGSLAALGETEDVAVISERLALKLDGRVGDPGAGALGQGFVVKARAYSVGAVMAPSFAFPSDRIMAWIPASPSTSPGAGDDRDGGSIAVGSVVEEKRFRMIVRLEPGVTEQQLSEDAVQVMRQIHGEYVAMPGGNYPKITPLEEAIVGDVRPALAASVVAAILVLLVTCANVAMILLGRATLRRRDSAVRLALGASVWRLARGSLAESLVLALVGSLCGAWLASTGLRLVLRTAADQIPRSHAIAIDGPILLAGVAMIFVVALACGLAPALAASRQDIAAAFRAGGSDGRRRGSSPLPTRRVLNGLVVAQLAASIVLLTGAALLAATVSRLLSEDAGFEPNGVVSMRLSSGDGGVVAPIAQASFGRRLVERVGTLPGVVAAGLGSSLPPQGLPFHIQVRYMTETRDESASLSVVSVTPGFLEALGVELVSGRRFLETDDLSGRPAVLLSESAARFYAPGEDLTGRELPLALPPFVPWNRPPRVLGIVSDVKYSGLDQPAAPAIYVPWGASPTATSHLVWRTSPNAPPQTQAVRRVLEQVDASLPVPEVRSLLDQMALTLLDRRLRVAPAMGFAGVALAVALTGVFAVLARSAAERRREMAIRLALGASRAGALAVLMRAAAALTLSGVVLGSVAALGASRGLSSLLYGISPNDPGTLLGAAGGVAIASMLAAWLPARRALRSTPAELLRSE